ncbi:uncharacterized protein LOC116096667 [Mastomys coucha]|uniref:uncharacterized protein LOC116096667 n=1 Tax=Mastomys coucha TaxID=35658 RepID=UPI001261B087|nr:uncharacterized protein LOC116096667 [Mastomys coucha]
MPRNSGTKRLGGQNDIWERLEGRTGSPHRTQPRCYTPVTPFRAWDSAHSRLPSHQKGRIRNSWTLLLHQGWRFSQKNRKVWWPQHSVTLEGSVASGPAHFFLCAVELDVVPPGLFTHDYVACPNGSRGPASARGTAPPHLITLRIRTPSSATPRLPSVHSPGSKFPLQTRQTHSSSLSVHIHPSPHRAPSQGWSTHYLPPPHLPTLILSP